MTQQGLFEVDTGPHPIAAAGPRFTPTELAKLLNRPVPTIQQAEIISAPVEPLLVVAGAGSGKTETMAARVVWLVANAYVRPEQILGLTFTRKAAGELAHRVRQRLSLLVKALGRDDLLAGEPTVATYHSYAARVVREHGVRAGYEPATRLLTEAACWQLADSVVRTYDGDMTDVAAAPSTVVDAVLHLAGDLAEHLRTPDDVASWTGRFYSEVQAVPGSRVPAPVKKMLDRQKARLQLLPLVRRYADRKATLEAMDFGDQLARAATVAVEHPEVGLVERDRYAVVLLDEYQDTSHAQVTLLRALFGGGHPVTAVGDPCQSIYGWRGASAGTLTRFPQEFPRSDGDPARELSLTTSWRNRPEILDVANALSRPLREHGARVAELAPADVLAEPASAATVHCGLFPSYLDEADWIAGRLVGAWQHAAAAPGALPWEIPVEKRPTTAVLVRTRAQIPPIEAALRAAGLPVEVVGLGGLLDTPEVRDVVSTLRVLADPAEGSALLRLLTGPRWRIGPRDLVALYRRARSLARERRLAVDSEPDLADALDEAVLVEALDNLGAPERYSIEGWNRFTALRDELRAMRYRLDQALPDLIADIERTIGLDVEVAARSGDAGLARAHLDAFGDIAARFSTESEGPTLSAFLAYLAAAENEERGLAPGDVEVVEGAVQILTAHAAKGLEWDLVAVVGLSEGVWPGRTMASDHWLQGLGVLPFPLRGDRAGLPALDLSAAADQKAVVRALDGFSSAWREHDVREERRLAYVGVTRPRRLLLCSGYWWSEGAKGKRGPSVFLEEIRDRCFAGAGAIDVWTPDPGPNAENPTLAHVARASWPGDPLGPRRPALTAAAELVRGPRAEGIDEDPDYQRWAYEAALLLAERDRSAPSYDVVLPAHLSVSQLVMLRRDPARLARVLRRPLPAKPQPLARRGTAFHRWIEERYGAARLLDLDELPGAADDGAAPDAELAALQEAFTASEWFDKVPVAVEVPFAAVVAGVVIRGRMDAVFSATGGSGFDVIDWKTGAQPTSAAEASAVAVQLAAYRLAWANLAGVPVDEVRAGFCYIRDQTTVRPADLLDEGGLVELITGLPPSSQ
ncbi:ATP-dependent DNA helicase [Virgisporangium ochraceum]|uniref:DNA 3'-5' helicase n=1 Tax=Virgisporangium ochraceum TaxID=65505 RepID=A0A8J3ZU44_9ACTN|nr:ATP-dependent DNA helicase [Virgisporangium ochraceum]GIJ70232.1 ATP-dependent DNA helicase [Virgisporangium ochraceum]